jgi:hypothetical protein
VSDHLSIELLECYGRRRLDPEQLLALDDHLATCTECREKLRETRPRHAALLSLRSSLEPAANQSVPDHLDSEQLRAYARGRLGSVDRELAEAHLETCRSCSAQSQKLSVSGGQQVNALGGTLPRSAQTLTTLLWDRLTAVLGMSRPRERSVPVTSIYRFAAAAVSVLALVIAVAMWLRTDTAEPEMAVQPAPSSPSHPAPRLPLDSSTPRSTPDVLTLNDGGGQVTLDAAGNLAGLNSLSPLDQQRVRTALTKQKVDLPRIVEELRDSSSTLMGSRTGAEFALLNPVGKVVVADRPTFRWQPLRDAIGYRVTITDPAAGYKEIATSPELQDTRWSVDHPLQRGRIYTWQVTARTASGEVKTPAPDAAEARFKILERVKADRIVRAEKTYPGQHLVMGVVYAEAGLVSEAAVEFRALAAANPDSAVARNLLRSMQARAAQ